MNPLTDEGSSSPFSALTSSDIWSAGYCRIHRRSTGRGRGPSPYTAHCRCYWARRLSSRPAPRANLTMTTSIDLPVHGPVLPATPGLKAEEKEHTLSQQSNWRWRGGGGGGGGGGEKRKMGGREISPFKVYTMFFKIWLLPSNFGRFFLFFFSSENQLANVLFLSEGCWCSGFISGICQALLLFDGGGGWCCWLVWFGFVLDFFVWLVWFGFGLFGFFFFFFFFLVLK